MLSSSSRAERRFSLSTTLSPFDPLEPARVVSVLDHTSHRRRKLNQYARGDKIGKGKHGDVYLCKDETKPGGYELAVKVIPRSNPRDKIKLLRKSARQESQNGAPPLSSTMNNIRKELAIMKICRHPNVVRLVEIIDDPREDKIYMIMDFLSGGPVEWSDEEKRPLLTLQQTRRIMRDTILGLEYLHHEGIIHRDVKPANILYTEDRRSVKIIDFGVAHYTPPPKSNGRKAERGSSFDYPIDPTVFPQTDLLKRVGTPSFLAPEVVWFQDDQPEASSPTHSKKPKMNPRPQITKAIDVWSLGVTFYCFLFGRTPFNVPSSANDNVHHNEFVLYQQISKGDYTVDNFMGADYVPTAVSRSSGSTPATEATMAVELLEQMLQKDPLQRTSLSEIKRRPWILRDIHDPDEWLKLTSPEYSSKGEEVRSLGQKLRSLLLGTC